MRKKQVFTSSELPHIWVNTPTGSNESGRNSSQNMSFDGDMFYSYSTEIAHRRIINGRVVYVFNTYSYSNTTAGHQSKLWNALLSERTISVNYPQWGSGENLSDLTTSQIADILRQENTELWNKAQTARDKGEFYIDHINSNLHHIKLLHEYTPADDIPANNADECKAIIERAHAAQERTRARNEAKAEKQRIEKERKQLERATKFALEYGVKNPESVDFNNTYLKIVGDEVVTSRGARVPLKQALLLYALRNTPKKLEGQCIGHYTITEVNADTIRINCHSIQWNEIDRVLAPLKSA